MNADAYNRGLDTAISLATEIGGDGSETLIAGLEASKLPGDTPLPCKWRAALEDASVVNWTLSAENKDDPRRQIYDIVAQCIREHDDPAINGGFVRVPILPEGERLHIQEV